MSSESRAAAQLEERRLRLEKAEREAKGDFSTPAAVAAAEKAAIIAAAAAAKHIAPGQGDEASVDTHTVSE
jgi:hypothetical protein